MRIIITRAWVFHHWGCRFGVRNEHNTLYFTLMYASLTIILVGITFRSIFKKTLCNVSTFAFKAHILFCLPLSFFSRGFSFLKSWSNCCTYLCWCWKRNCLFGQLKVVNNVITPPPPVEHKRACATYMSTTATSEMLKKEHAAVTWKNRSPPRVVDPNNNSSNNCKNNNSNQGNTNSKNINENNNNNTNAN